MFVAVTNDGGFYALRDETDAIIHAEIFEIDFNDWAFNVFEVPEMVTHFTGISYNREEER
jgi:hypothetical protein